MNRTRYIFALLAIVFASSCTKTIIEEIEVIREVIKEVEKEVVKEVHDTLYIEVTDPDHYEWEKGRYRCPAISDMVLCYGGSPIRYSTDWPQSRFAEYVSYVDESGQEHWLFDSFLALEWRDVDMTVWTEDDRGDLSADGAYCLTGGHDYHSARKEGWQRQLDFWFTDKDNGFNGLDKAVAAAAERLGEPPVKRRVVMFMPDAIPYETYNDPSSTTVYWGEIDGVQMDFSNDMHRLMAYKWYIDTARAMFAKRQEEGLYKNIELIGFYIMSEDLKHPRESGTDYSRLYTCVRPIADYLHAVNEYLFWIPYRKAWGTHRGWDLGIDYIWLQPNYYEHAGESGYSMSSFVNTIISDGLGMEIEFDRKSFFRYDGQYEASKYSSRFKEYMQYAKSSTAYGERPFTYYILTDWKEDVMKLFRTSGYEKDKELYHQFCRFVIENPMREKLTE